LIDDNNPPVSFATFSPNGEYILASALDSTIRLWSSATGRCVKTFKGHKNVKYCIFSTFLNDQFIVSGSEDGLIYIWDMYSQEMEQLKGHNDTVLSVTVHPTLPMIASCSNDLSIRIWNKHVKF
jgi:COMPASS component SWD3